MTTDRDLDRLQAEIDIMRIQTEVIQSVDQMFDSCNTQVIREILSRLIKAALEYEDNFGETENGEAIWNTINAMLEKVNEFDDELKK